MACTGYFQPNDDFCSVWHKIRMINYKPFGSHHFLRYRTAMEKNALRRNLCFRTSPQTHISSYLSSIVYSFSALTVNSQQPLFPHLPRIMENSPSILLRSSTESSVPSILTGEQKHTSAPEIAAARETSPHFKNPGRCTAMEK